MQNTPATFYLQDLGLLIKEEAIEAKARQVASGDSYDSGYLMAFYGVVSLMQSQAKGFDIPLSDINLSDIDPDKDLV